MEHADDAARSEAELAGLIQSTKRRKLALDTEEMLGSLGTLAPPSGTELTSWERDGAQQPGLGANRGGAGALAAEEVPAAPHGPAGPGDSVHGGDELRDTAAGKPARHGTIPPSSIFQEAVHAPALALHQPFS